MPQTHETIDLEQIDKYFPMKHYRPGQKQAIEHILQAFDEGIKYVFLEAPTGSGKSAIGFTVAQFFEDSYYLAPQKFLQDQLMKDFGDDGRHIFNLPPMVDLKGRNAYPCNYWDRVLNNEGDPEHLAQITEQQRERFAKLAAKHLGCDEGECKRQDVSKLDYCDKHCVYFNRLYKALASKICLMNFHSFLFQSAVVHRFGHRKLLIIDESHNSESVLMKFVEMKVSDRLFQGKVKFPRLKSVQQYLDYFDKIAIDDLIMERRMSAIANEETKIVEQLDSLRMRLKQIRQSSPEDWVSIWEKNDNDTVRTIYIKPIFVKKYAKELLFDIADHVLFMSATILRANIMSDSLGINHDECKFFQLPSTFPASKRRIYYRPCGKMNYREKQDTLPKVVEEINFLCDHHKGQRGIIHTHSFDIMRYILDNCDSDVRNRLLHQNQIQFKGDKKLLLSLHAEKSDSIIIAPAMHEGLDLKDDLGRFQILCKIPYPSKGDPQIAARMKLSGQYYNWLSALKLVQSYGRIIRHDKDHGVTYVLDSGFRYFVESNSHMIPEWFLEAIKWS